MSNSVPQANPFGNPEDALSTATFDADLTNVDGGYLNSAGTFLGRVKEIKKQMSRSGNPMFVVDLEVVDGPESGKSTRTWLTLTEKAMWKVAEFYTAIGVATVGQKASPTYDDIVGKLVQFTTSTRTYTTTDENGDEVERTTANVESVTAPPAGAGARYEAAAAA